MVELLLTGLKIFVDFKILIVKLERMPKKLSTNIKSVEAKEKKAKEAQAAAYAEEKRKEDGRYSITQTCTQF